MRSLATKHTQILNYIDNLAIGNKISVRQIAKELHVSEGTAYRAIKDAESKGYVSTIERVGTIRIEKKKKENFEKLTYAEIVKIVDGQVLGGREGLYKTLNKFVIGAMELTEMMQYTEKGNLLIVGNRTEAHQLALERGAAVLITGGFDAEEYVKRLADEQRLPIISTSYDTFTVATLINRAIYDQLIKKEIVHVEDIYIPIEDTIYLSPKDKVEKWYEYEEETSHGRYPVLDDNMKVVGVITSKDIIGADRNTLIEKVMTKIPVVVSEKTSVSSASRMMVWEGVEILPVVNEYNDCKGVISRQDVLKASQTMQRQPHVGETLDDLVTNHFTYIKEAKEQGIYHCRITPQMANSLGTLSYGVFVTILTEVCQRALREHKKTESVVENITVYYIRPIQIETTVKIVPKILSLGRKFGKVDIEAYQDGSVVGKALLMVQLIDR